MQTILCDSLAGKWRGSLSPSKIELRRWIDAQTGFEYAPAVLDELTRGVLQRLQEKQK